MYLRINRQAVLYCVEIEECSRAIHISIIQQSRKTLEPWRSSSAVRLEEAFCGWHAPLLTVLQCVLPKASLLHQVAQGVAARGSTLLYALYVTGRLVELEQCLINTLQHKAAGSGYITVLGTLYCLRHLQIQYSLNQFGSYARGISIARVRGMYEWVHNSSPWLQGSTTSIAFTHSLQSPWRECEDIKTQSIYTVQGWTVTIQKE